MDVDVEAFSLRSVLFLGGKIAFIDAVDASFMLRPLLTKTHQGSQELSIRRLACHIAESLCIFIYTDATCNLVHSADTSKYIVH